MSKLMVVSFVVATRIMGWFVVGGGARGIEEKNVDVAGELEMLEAVVE